MHNRDLNSETVHWSFWLIVVAALVWNLMGVLNFFMQLDESVVAGMSESHKVIIGSRPVWATVAFAFAVLGGSLGCFFLLFRKSAAFYLFVISLAGVIVQLIPHFDLVDSDIVSVFQIFLMIFMPLIVAVLLVWYSKYAIKRGWVGSGTICEV